VLYLPINKDWIISRTARRVYLVCAILSFSLIGTVFASKMALLESGSPSLSASPGAAVLVKFLLWPGILGTALLSTAMWYYWFEFDTSGWVRKAIWFGPLYIFFGFGPALYYFFVYRRNVDRAAQAQAAGKS